MNEFDRYLAYAFILILLFLVISSLILFRGNYYHFVDSQYYKEKYRNRTQINFPESGLYIPPESIEVQFYSNREALVTFYAGHASDVKLKGLHTRVTLQQNHKIKYHLPKDLKYHELKSFVFKYRFKGSKKLFVDCGIISLEFDKV